MQINNKVNSAAFHDIEAMVSVKQGDMVPLKIIKRTGKQEALVRIKGQDVHVQFTGKMPPGEEATVIIGQMNEKGFLVVHPASSQQQEPAIEAKITDSLKRMMAEAGFLPETNHELLLAVKTAAKGGAVNGEVIGNLYYFLTEENGTIAEKLYTIETLSAKNLELSVSQLRAVHHALHGENLAESLSRLIKSLAPSLVAGEETIAMERELSTSQEELAGTEREERAVEQKATWPQQNAVAHAASVPQSLQSKQVIITEITEKLAKLAVDFQSEQHVLLQNLDKMIRQPDTKQQMNMKQILEQTIKQLNQMLLKSDFMLYADMATEKKLLQAGSQLREAELLLEKGNIAKAKEIVYEVKTEISKLKYEPAHVTVRHMTKDVGQVQEGELDVKFHAKPLLAEALQPFLSRKHGTRQVFEQIQALGLTYEQDLARKFIDISKGTLTASEIWPEERKHPSEPAALPISDAHVKPRETELVNVKHALLKLLQSEQGEVRPYAKEAEQIVTQLTGRQLLHKAEPVNTRQFYWELPFLLGETLENIKVYLSADKKGKAIDWENCHLYFVLETEKMGTVGIDVHVQNRRLSLTLKNDTEVFRKKVMPLADEALERLREIGFHIGTLKFDPLSNRDVPKSEPCSSEEKELRRPAPIIKKGIDFSI